MKRIPRIMNALLGLLIMFLGTTAYAQPGQGRQGPPPLPDDQQIEEMVADLAKELSLTEAQEAKVSELYFAHFEEAKKLAKNNQEKRREDREVKEKLRDDFEKDVKTLLTKEQQDQFDAFQKKNKPQRGKGQRPERKG